jgi:hypothetical protein
MIVKGVNQQSVTFVGSGWPVNQTTTVMDKKKKTKKTILLLSALYFSNATTQKP